MAVRSGPSPQVVRLETRWDRRCAELGMRRPLQGADTRRRARGAWSRHDVAGLRHRARPRYDGCTRAAGAGRGCAGELGDRGRPGSAVAGGRSARAAGNRGCRRHPVDDGCRVACPSRRAALRCRPGHQRRAVAEPGAGDREAGQSGAPRALGVECSGHGIGGGSSGSPSRRRTVSCGSGHCRRRAGCSASCRAVWGRRHRAAPARATVAEPRATARRHWRTVAARAAIRSRPGHSGEGGAARGPAPGVPAIRV